VIGLKVFIYWNFRKKKWSIQHKNKVIGHRSNVKLKDAYFRVSERGRQRVLENGTKNVHAGVVGTIEAEGSSPTFGGLNLSEENMLISYNPYKMPWFYDVSTLKLIDNKNYETIHMCSNGKLII
jgi:hypothetical protein